MGNIPRFVYLYYRNMSSIINLNVLPFKPMITEYISLQEKKKKRMNEIQTSQDSSFGEPVSYASGKKQAFDIQRKNSIKSRMT